MCQQEKIPHVHKKLIFLQSKILQIFVIFEYQNQTAQKTGKSTYDSKTLIDTRDSLRNDTEKDKSISFPC